MTAIDENHLFAVPEVEPSVRLEPALEMQEAKIEALTKQSKRLNACLTKWKKAASVGNLDDMTKATEAAKSEASELAVSVQSTAASWRFDSASWLGSGNWMSEVREIAMEKQSLRVRIDGPDLICPPLCLRAKSDGSALMSGRAVRKELRPSTIARDIAAARARLRGKNDQEFLEALYKAWKARPNPDAVVLKFKDAYKTFCLAPGWSKENKEGLFQESVLSLAKSRIGSTKDGTRYRLEQISGGFRPADAYFVRDEDGKEIDFVGIRFLI